MPCYLKRILFVLFFLSGFCSLLYQVIWLRMAYASFGATTPVLSLMISIFMLGFSIGSFVGGRFINGLAYHFKKSPVIFYALAEFCIGLGAFAVPELFFLGKNLLLSSGEMNSSKYLILSAIIITFSVLPWCIFMGFTYPFMMSFFKGLNRRNPSGFSYLYLANVLGAMSGTLLTAWIIIEIAGFRNSLLTAALINFLIFLASITTGIFYPYKKIYDKESEYAKEPLPSEKETKKVSSVFIHTLLLFTGFVSMAMEVIWIRAFTPILLNTIYSFASLLTVYLFATSVGIFLYRIHLDRKKVISTGYLLACLAIFSFLPIIVNDPRLIISVPLALISIFPFCAGLGYLMPKLIDEYSLGRPYEAGKAYAFNIIGCVIGPLFASYVLLPNWGVKFSLIILGIPFLLFFILYYKREIFQRKRFAIITAFAVLMVLTATFINISYEEVYVMPEEETTDRKFYVLPDDCIVRRDYVATVVSSGAEMSKLLLINGIPTTSLKPVTKMMAHLPLIFCPEKPSSALVICLGMGTTFRSALSWNINVTAIELVPSVKKAMGYYFADTDLIMKNLKGNIIIDDGRRFLNRTNETFDIITIDPPPPLESAGSSFLYSEEFYELAQKHLKQKGILQQWFPCGELKIAQATARALSNSFPYVKIYKSVEGWGLHFLASMNPIKVPSVQTALSRIPDTARKDITEWYQIDRAELFDGFIRFVLKSEISLSELLNDDKKITITDDRPFNEYFFMRRTIDRLRGKYVEISCEP
ncbi:MAG: fused MFS/spermidine synthase [Syntrophaceae bacterium]|nr:fused MFS/spermidine synthase [Syntrophaceae bacterium]